MDRDRDELEELTPETCWALLRTATIGHLAVWVADHPEIFPLNYVVDHGTLVFRSGQGTKVSSALAEAPVALEADGYDPSTSEAWSVLVQGRAQNIQRGLELLDTLEQPLFPWHAGAKNRYIRIVPQTVTGRRFAVADPEYWRSQLPVTRRLPMD